MNIDRRRPKTPLALWILLLALTAPFASAQEGAPEAAPEAAPEVKASERPAPAGPTPFVEREQAWQEHTYLERNSLFKNLPWRSVGPVIQGGRVVDVESVPGEPYTFYVAYASGGLWRTNNNGVTFEPLFDDQATMIMGDVAIDPTEAKTIWVGTGENNSSRSSYGGHGVFRSRDAGETWEFMGLGATDRIGRMVIDPRDPSRLFVASLGKLYTPGGERGIYRTTDGGETWRQVLAGDEWTGFVDLVMHPENPDVLYAAAWERQRRPWDFVEGGEGSAIWKTTDGGETWNKLTEGLPQGSQVGRIGLTICRDQPETLYASVDNQELLPEELWDLGSAAITPKRLRTMSEEEFLEYDPEEIEAFIRSNDLATSLDAALLIEMLKNDEISIQDLRDEIDDANANLFQTDIRGIEIYRSDDGGETWRMTHEEPIRDVVFTYGYYFGQIRVAPDDPDRIYVLGVPMITSGDGGESFETLYDPDVHVDYQAMWIDPNYPDRLVVGNDGGLDVSYDGGASWLKLDAQPVGQFYAINVDMADPYNIYGGLQDNGTLKGSSQTRWEDGPSWQRIGGGDGMYVAIDPRDNTVYNGFQFGFYFRQGPGGRQEVRPRDELGEASLRYNWNTPVKLSTHNADVVYFGANKLFRSLDQGETWTAISPDLTRSEKRGDVPFATITTHDESPLVFGLLWAGTDDGWVHVSEDGGHEWRDVLAGLPTDRWVSRVEASSFDAKVAYISLNGYRDDDMTPYVYRTEDLGATWQDLSANLPAEPVNVVREDPVNEDVLYVGTDRGVYVSLDRGENWQALQGELPNVPVHDLVVHPRERELVAGTHGRSVWVVDVLPVQELDAELREEPVAIFPVEPVSYRRGWKNRQIEWFYLPENDPEVKIPFWAAKAGKAELAVLDGDGRELRKLELDAERGVNVFTWDLLLDSDLALAAEKAKLGDAEKEKVEKKKGKKKDAEEAESTEGHRGKTPWAEAVRLGWPLYATPGTYELEVRMGEEKASTEFEMKAPEPREPRQKPEPKIRGQKDDDRG